MFAPTNNNRCNTTPLLRLLHLLRQRQQQQQHQQRQRKSFLSFLPSVVVGGGGALPLGNLHRCYQTRQHSTATTSTHNQQLVSLLKDPSLLNPSAVRFDNVPGYFPVYDPAAAPSAATPASCSIPALARVRNMNRAETRHAIEVSSKVLPSWRDETTASYRSQRLLQWSRLIQEHQDDLAVIMTLESGKPLAESYSEISYGTSYLDFYAGEALRPHSAGGGFIIPTPFSSSSNTSSSSTRSTSSLSLSSSLLPPPPPLPRGQVWTWQQAVGVTALITPWNFPLAMLTRKVGPALAVGCTALVKPSDRTPLTAVALHTLSQRAGIPPDVFQFVTCDAATTPEVGAELCTNPLVHKISFTGSTTVGKLLFQLSSSTVKRMSLELGGNAPFVVFADANLDQAVDAAWASKFRHAGQTCVCANRFLIHEAVHDEFVARFQAKIEHHVRVGPGMDPTTTMGPLITADAVQQVHAKVQEAVDEHGAHVLLGGSPLTELGSHFYPPTLVLLKLRDNVVNPTLSRLWNTETFGPVAPIVRFKDDAEALTLANDTRAGLAAYFCTQDLSRAFWFAQRLECGMVGVNEGIISTCMAPFGGIKESGLGREGSSLGLAEYLETKYVLMNA